MNLTLEDNNVPDERELYAKLNLVRTQTVHLSRALHLFAGAELADLSVCDPQPDDFYAPLIHLYFNDDLTEA